MQKKSIIRSTAFGIFTLLIALSCLWGFHPANAGTTTLKAPKPIVWRDYLGVNAHLLWFSPEQYRQQIRFLRDLGLEWIRVDLHWALLEPKKGQYKISELDTLINELKNQQMKSAFYLVGSAPHATSAPPGAAFQDQYPPRDRMTFVNTMDLLAQRYPSVDAWQIWNEPNLPAYWRPTPNSSQFLQLLQSSVQALNKTSDKKIIAAGMAYFGQAPNGGNMLTDLEKYMASNPGLVVAYHPYTLQPEGNTPDNQDFVTRAKSLNASIRSKMPNEIWATEWGWSSYPGPKEEQPIIGTSGQADYMLRRLALMSALDYDKIFLFTLSDLDARARVRDRSYGLLDLQGAPKPAYNALKNFLNITGPTLFPDDPPTIQNPPDNFYSIAWRREDGKHLWMFWSTAGGKVSLPAINQATLYNPLTGNQTNVKGDQGISITVTPSLGILVW